MTHAANPPSCWDVTQSASLDAILTWCLRERHADRLLMATRLDTDASGHPLLVPEVEVVAKKLFGRAIRRTLLATAWPGTQLIEHPGRVFVIDFDNHVRRTMVETENRLGGWNQWHAPPLPEDICAYREGDPYPCLVSVTHDDDAWIVHDGKVDNRLAIPSRAPLPMSLIPSPPDFVTVY